MTGDGQRRRLDGAAVPRGGEVRTLLVAGAAWRFEGLDADLASALDARWGPFVAERAEVEAAVVEVTDAGREGWLAAAVAGEHYRIEPLAGGPPGVVSYGFAIARRAQHPERWRLALTSHSTEPPGRAVENATRWLVARRVIEAGGVALHGAGIERAGRGWVFAGPSNVGKTTAVGLSGDVRSLGDDFAAILPWRSGFRVAPVPFDNRERVDEAPPAGAIPLAAVLRLRQAPEHRLVRPPRGLAVAALASCAAFPWALPDLADRLLANAAAVAGAGRVAELYFTRDAGFWALLDSFD